MKTPSLVRTDNNYAQKCIIFKLYMKCTKKSFESGKYSCFALGFPDIPSVERNLVFDTCFIVIFFHFNFFMLELSLNIHKLSNFGLLLGPQRLSLILLCLHLCVELKKGIS